MDAGICQPGGYGVLILWLGHHTARPFLVFLTLGNPYGIQCGVESEIPHQLRICVLWPGIRIILRLIRLYVVLSRIYGQMRDRRTYN